MNIFNTKNRESINNTRIVEVNHIEVLVDC